MSDRKPILDGRELIGTPRDFAIDLGLYDLKSSIEAEHMIRSSLIEKEEVRFLERMWLSPARGIQGFPNHLLDNPGDGYPLQEI